MSSTSEQRDHCPTHAPYKYCPPSGLAQAMQTISSSKPKPVCTPGSTHQHTYPAFMPPSLLHTSSERDCRGFAGMGHQTAEAGDVELNIAPRIGIGEGCPLRTGNRHDDATVQCNGAMAPLPVALTADLRPTIANDGPSKGG